MWGHRVSEVAGLYSGDQGDETYLRGQAVMTGLVKGQAVNARKITIMQKRCDKDAL